MSGDNSTSVTLVLGGARSGKTRFAETLVLERARTSGKQAVYLATAQAFDAEMADRIARHRDDRSGQGWRTVETPTDLVGAIGTLIAEAEETGRPPPVVLIDCLTLWVTNLMMAERSVEAETATLLAFLETKTATSDIELIFVSNEVGLSIVPENAMARAFRDHAGRLHQAIAAFAGKVFLIVAGIPMTVKAP